MAETQHNNNQSEQSKASTSQSKPGRVAYLGRAGSDWDKVHAVGRGCGPRRLVVAAFSVAGVVSVALPAGAAAPAAAAAAAHDAATASAAAAVSTATAISATAIVVA